jgi:excisionase family DNA binding protein
VSEKRWLRVKDAAVKMGLSTRKVYEMAQDGRIPHARIDGCVRIPAEPLEKWMTEREREGYNTF